VAGLEHSFKEDTDLTEEEVLNRNRIIHFVDYKINSMLKSNSSKKEIREFWIEWKKNYKISRENLNVYYRNLHKFKQGETDNFMDYYNNGELFWKFQWKALQDDILKFYKNI
jgi:hypothetical protein